MKASTQSPTQNKTFDSYSRKLRDKEFRGFVQNFVQDCSNGTKNCASLYVSLLNNDKTGRKDGRPPVTILRFLTKGT